jgi:CheY-like chemotaxis protein
MIVGMKDATRRKTDRADVIADRSDVIRRLHCRILVVDDEESFRESFADRLRDTYETYVVTAENARIASQMLTEMEAFDLILMDVEMPRQDGIEACRKMRDSGVSGRIVLMSSKAENAERVHAIGEEFFEKGDDDALEAILLACKGAQRRE